MRKVENISINGVGVDRLGDALCVFGEVEYECEDSSLRITFEGFPCHNMVSILNMITEGDGSHYGKIVMPGLKIYSNKMTLACFNKTVRRLFALAIGSVPTEFINVSVEFKEEWEEA